MIPFFRIVTHKATVSCRYFSSDPFRILGIRPGSSYDEVRRAFVQLALEHHPDRDEGNHASFVRIRQAFEAIRDGSHSEPSGWSQDDLRQWYREETGEFLSFSMSESTRQEVIKAYKTLSQGGKDKGGYWEMARQLAEREHVRGDDDGPIHQIESGPETTVRRRRKR